MAKQPTKSTAATRTKASPRTQKTAKAKAKANTGQSSPSLFRQFLRGLWRYGWKVGLVFGSGLFLYGIYLDGQIARQFDGQRWHLPAQIFARPMALYPDAPVTHNQLRQELLLLGYRNTGRAQGQGEFAVANNRIEIHRRPFDGPEGHQPAIKVLVSFVDNRVSKVQRSQDGRELGYLQLEPLLLDRLLTGEREDRIFVAASEIPPTLIEALLRTEDQDFYRHMGVSVSGIARAAVVNLRAGRTVQGGSTLTQQLAKNFFLTRERTFGRKINEALMALIIDARYSKDEILETYLNEVYMGQDGAIGVHGVGLAAWHYFGRPIGELDLAQQALLVALIKGPSYYNPWRYPERAQQRRDLVLSLLAESGVLALDRYQDWVSTPLNLRDPSWRQRHHMPAYRTLIQRELSQNYGAQMSAQSGLKVYTTLDPLAQQAAEKALAEGMPVLMTQRQDSDLQAAMVVVDRYHGGVLALVGDRDPTFRGFNRALDAQRPIGSLAKPLLFVTALSQPHQFHLMTALQDQPIRLRNGSQQWQPQNVDKKFRGQVSLQQTLIDSLNVPVVNMGMSLGMEAYHHTLHAAGWQGALNANPSVFLGSMDASPYQVAQLYQTLADGGRYRPLYSISHVIDGQNQPLPQQRLNSEQRLPPNAVWLTNYLMTKVVRQGTAKRLGAHYPQLQLAGKTGTSSDGRDAWYAGFDDRDVVVTWVGRDNNSAAGLYGGSAALPLYQRYLAVREPLSLILTRPHDIVDGFYAHNGEAVVPGCMGAVQVPIDRASQVTPRGCGNLSQASQPSVAEPASSVQEASKRNWFERLLGR